MQSKFILSLTSQYSTIVVKKTVQQYNKPIYNPIFRFSACRKGFLDFVESAQGRSWVKVLIAAKLNRKQQHSVTPTSTLRRNRFEKVRK